MRILCLNYEYPPIGGGGGRAAAQINAGLVRRGHQVLVQTAGMKHLPANEIVDGVEIRRTESHRRREDTCSVPEMALFLATSFAPTLRTIRAWKPDILHVHFAVPSGALAWPVHRITGVPYVLTAHLGDVPGGVPEQTAGLFRFVQPFTRPIWKNAAAVTAVSTFTADLAEQAYGIRPVVVPNGIVISQTGLRLPNSVPRILMIGRMSAQKNPLLAIEALAGCRDLAWEAEFIGDGPLRKAAELSATRIGLEERIHFAGWLTGPEVANRLASGDILLMTSLSEGLPMVAIEALQHGLAIVSTRIGGVLDVVTDGVNGCLSDSTAAGMGSGLRAVLSDPALLRRYQQESAARAPKFDIENVVTAYEKVLTSIGEM